MRPSPVSAQGSQGRVASLTAAAAVGGHAEGGEARNHLDVEDPPREERLREHAVQVGRHPEELRAALRVVDRQPERQRREGREDAPEVVPLEGALDLPPEQRDARAEDHLDLRVLVQHGRQLLDRRQRRRQVAVPEADHLGRALLERVHHA